MASWATHSWNIGCVGAKHGDERGTIRLSVPLLIRCLWAIRSISPFHRTMTHRTFCYDWSILRNTRFISSLHQRTNIKLQSGWDVNNLSNDVGMRGISTKEWIIIQALQIPTKLAFHWFLQDMLLSLLICMHLKLTSHWRSCLLCPGEIPSNGWNTSG